jgi:hypothetical protein
LSAGAPRRGERALVVVLRLSGALTLSAFLAMLLPVEWMAAMHARLGMGVFPEAPVTVYLCRSIAAVYGMHGVLVLLVARDVRRYRSIVAYIGGATAAFGALMIPIDLQAGMPWWWILGEGPVLLGEGWLLLGLLRSVPRTAPRGEGGEPVL